LFDFVLTGLCIRHNIPKFENSELRPEPTRFRAQFISGNPQWLSAFEEGRQLLSVYGA